MNPIAYSDYKAFIRDAIQKNSESRGYQGKLAEAARCQKSYFSQVVNGHTNLNQDQAIGLCEFWHFDEDETDYFLELVNLARSQHPSLAKRIKNKLKKYREKHEKRTKRSGASEVIVNEQWLYYSQWHWSAIHILVGIQRFQKIDAIAKCLGLPEHLVRDTLEILKQQNLVDHENGKWVIKPIHRHLSSDSPLNAMNHSNWRQRAILDSQFPQPSSLHYTSVQSHGTVDREKLKQIFLDAIGQSRDIISRSPNEEMTCLCLDFFSLT
jgi:uncharacterized protein (TIGR02147 family)